MKKIFSLLMVLVAAVAMNATVVTLTPSDFAGVDPAAAVDQTVQEFNFKITNGLINADQIRVYKNSTLTISGEKEISAIVFTCTAGGTDNYGPGNFEATPEGYTYKNTVGTWQGSATAKSIAFKASGAQVRLTKIEIYLDGEVPAVDTWVADTISVSKALELIDASDAHDHYVIGVVAGQPFNLFSDFKAGKVSFWMTDVENSADSIEAYQVLGKDTAKWESLEAAWEELRVGDTILVYAASLAKYQSTYEIGSGFYAEKLGANPNPPEIVDPDAFEIPEGYITCAAAMELAAGLADPTAENKTVKGETVRICAAVTYAYALADGKQSAWLDDKKAGSGLIQAAYLATSAEVAKGDIVLVEGKVAKYFRAGKDGAADEIIIEVVDGTMVKQGAEGIENVQLTEKAQKVMVDGVIYIIRDNKMYNVQGTQVR